MSKEIDSLIDELIRNPSKLSEIDLSDEVLTELSKELGKKKGLNPYSLVNPEMEAKQRLDEPIYNAAYCSYTNLSQDYISRFTMTGMVGFIYRMFKEYEVDPKLRCYVDDKKIDDRYLDKTATQRYEVNKLEGMIKNLSVYMEQLKQTNTLIEQIEYLFLNYELEKKEPSNKEKKDLETLKKAVSVSYYAITQALIDYGEDAQRRIHSTLDECKKYKDVVDEINSRGLKLPPSPETVVVPEGVVKRFVKDFIDKYFEFDADEHVKAASKTPSANDDVNYDQYDPSRPTMKLLKAKALAEQASSTNDLIDVFKDRQTYNACMHLLNTNPSLLQKLASNPDKCREVLTPITQATELIDHIPPADTFHRWNYYMEVNMEEIRSVVSSLYHEKPELDFAINVYETAEGTMDELEKKKKEFIVKHNDELCSDLKIVPMGKWAFLGDFKANREKIDFYNRHTEILKRIMDEHEGGKKLGSDLMKKRVKKAKSKNIEEEGKDAKILEEYKKQVADLSAMGATRVLDANERRAIEDAKKAIKDLEEVKDVPDDAIQVNVYVHDTEKGEVIKNKIYTEASEPPTPAEVAATNKAAIEAMNQ